MAKKLCICKGNSCKQEGSFKIIKTWAKELKIRNKIKKSKCLGLCSKAYGVKYKGKSYSCDSKSELEKILDGKK
jgi:NADH:ubiquinone oxidoreductase subunit E